MELKGAVKDALEKHVDHPALWGRIEETLFYLERELHRGRIAFTNTDSGIRDLVGNLASSNPGRVRDSLAELENAVRVAREESPASKIYVGLREQDIPAGRDVGEGLPRPSISGLDMDLYYRAPSGERIIDQVKRTPKSAFRDVEKQQFERYDKWLNQADEAPRSVRLVVGETGPEFYQLLRPRLLDKLSQTIVKSEGETILVVGGRKFSYRQLEQMGARADKLKEAAKKERGAEFDLGQFLEHNFNTLEATLETLEMR